MDKWVVEFQKKNGRKPTFAEFQAHNNEQKSAAKGATSVQQSAESVKPSESAAPQQTQAGQLSAPAQPEMPAGSNRQVQSGQTPTPAQAKQPTQAEEPTQANKPAQGNPAVQPTQQAMANQMVQPTKQATANPSTNVNQTVPPTPSTQNTVNAQTVQGPINPQPTQNTVGVQQTQNFASATQAQPVNGAVNAQSGPQVNNPEGPKQQQATPQNAAMAQQDVAQPDQPPAPKKASKSGSKVKHFFFSPLGITAMAVVIFLIGFVTTGFLTSTSRNSLRNKYNTAVRNNDTKSLLALFPKDQTESRFAEVGAEQLIESKKSFEDIENASSNDDFSLASSRHLLFFTNYSLNASTTMIDQGDTPKDSQLKIGDRALGDKDLKIAFFPGTYKIKAEVKNDFGEAEFTTEVKAGKNKTATLKFNIEDNYVTLPVGPSSITVSYNGKETDVKLSDKPQKIGPFKEEDSDGRKPKELLTLNGEYGGVKISNAQLDQMDDDFFSFKLDGKDMVSFYPRNVSFDRKKFDPYVKAFASDWYKAGQKGSTEGLDTLSDLSDDIKLPSLYEDTKTIKNAYKGVEFSKFEPYNVYIGRGENLYIVAHFYVVYTRTESGKKGAKPKTLKTSTMFVFRLDKDGEMKAVGDYMDLRPKD